MITIKSTTKRGAGFVASYNRSNRSRLSDCYGKYSTEKARAESNCRAWCNEEGGDGFRIMSFNTFGFSCGWRTAAGLRVETPVNSYLIAW